MVRLAVNLPKIAQYVSLGLPIGTGIFALGGFFITPWLHIGTVIFGLGAAHNYYYKHVQKQHSILRNFGVVGALRYILESIGPELRQYFYDNDIEERPFNRSERSEVYRKAKNLDSAMSFGSQKEFDRNEIKIKHSFFPMQKKDLDKYSVTFGEERKLKTAYTITKPIMISAMSYGALGENAIRALSRGARLANIPMNTGEGGCPKYHLMEGSDVIFQIGTAKFGVRNDDATLNDEKLKKIADFKPVKMIEIKLSQGAKPGKGGLLPKEKISEEIAELRGVAMGRDVISPERHVECDNPTNTVKFIKRVQDVSKLPVGIKFCLGCPDEFRTLVKEMKRQKVFPDYIAVDGAEGGTGAAPKSFMDDVGIPLFAALDMVVKILKEERVRNKLKITASGKLINPGKQMAALAHGADAIYSARGFMLALGCIQALQCNKNTCPVGITTHDPELQRGLDIQEKARRVSHYVKNLEKEFYELLSASGCKNYKELRRDKIYEPHPIVTVEN